ncbi:hypothetical protein SRABI27_00356 [Pedobacter sp. Bi27]|uniref:hypothetical protein n=1 Tax=unclassified Pedobacter TaxID=2628915 RepID=UPI001D3D01EA|nr:MULTISPECIES: hypothetical protein [unclassified Pedobacter]CAH0143827.1 hypothetical protein SRABI126_00361 [Pedobacter sp. Bi126]CAH0144215.1 hypothetical protein SRABI27_00356 [Pedobacter sp. Bi27]CAH0214519.1 hypothetical protein SRABI36_02320 [Pedobacter sp. Bi36]
MKNQETLNSGKLRIIIILSVIASILAIPLIAMQFTNEVQWDLRDFVAAGILLLSTGLAIELVIRNMKTGTSRTIVLIVILIALFLIWAEMAVGIFGSPIAGS